MRTLSLAAAFFLFALPPSLSAQWGSNNQGWQWTFMGWVSFDAGNWAWSDQHQVWMHWSGNTSNLMFWMDYDYIIEYDVYTIGNFVTQCWYYADGWNKTSQALYPNVDVQSVYYLEHQFYMHYYEGYIGPYGLFQWDGAQHPMHGYNFKYDKGVHDWSTQSNGQSSPPNAPARLTAPVSLAVE